MGIESGPSQSLGRISPSDIISKGEPVVTPNAVSALTDAFRNGFITADDVIARVGEHAKTKEKAQVALNKEVVSPENTAARAGAVQAATSGSTLQNAQNVAGLPLVQPQADVAAAALEQQQAYQKYPAAAFFDKFAPSLGLEAPLDADGKPDWSKKAQIGAQLATWDANRTKAKDELANIDTHVSADGTQLIPVTKQGMPVPVSHVKMLQDTLRAPFQAMQPGAVSVAPAASTPAPTPISPAPTASVGVNSGAAPSRADMLGGVTSTNLPPEVTPLASPAASKTVVSPVGSVPSATSPIGDTAFSLGPPKAKDKGEKPIPAEGVEKLATSQQALRTANQLRDAYAKLIAQDPQFTGLIGGTITKAAMGKRWNDAVAAFEREATAILAPVAKGTFNETGVLSDKDVERYKDVIPDLRDKPSVGNQKIQRLLQDVNQAYANKLETWTKAGYDTSGFTADMSAPVASTAAPPAGASTPVTLSTGKRVYRDASGKLVVMPQ